MKLLIYHIRNASSYPPNWRSLRRSLLGRESYCEFCGSRKRLQVHHIVPVHVKPELAAEIGNLIVLCAACHLRFGHLGDFVRFYDPVLERRAGESLLHINTLRGNV